MAEKDGESAAITLVLKPDAVARLRVSPVSRSSDPGYDYSWYCKE